MTLLVLIAQTAADAERSVPLDPLLRWLAIPSVVLAILVYAALSSFTAFMRRWFKNPESGSAEMVRRSLGAAEQEKETATFILDLLGKRHEETKGFIGRLYASELRESAETSQLAKEAHDMAAANRDTLGTLQKALVQQADSLRLLPALQDTLLRFDRTMDKVQEALQKMTDRLARMEGAFDSWDGNDRRQRDHDRRDGR